jgi:hypothetical protein
MKSVKVRLDIGTDFVASDIDPATAAETIAREAALMACRLNCSVVFWYQPGHTDITVSTSDEHVDVLNRMEKARDARFLRWSRIIPPPLSDDPI